jgi:hypothetical protein
LIAPCSLTEPRTPDGALTTGSVPRLPCVMIGQVLG